MKLCLGWSMNQQMFCFSLSPLCSNELCPKLEHLCTIPLKSTWTSIHCRISLIFLLKSVPVTQDKYGATRELGHWMPCPTFPLLGQRWDTSNPDVVTIQARRQLHSFTRQHMLKKETERCVRAECNCMHLTDAHWCFSLKQY